LDESWMGVCGQGDLNTSAMKLWWQVRWRAEQKDAGRLLGNCRRKGHGRYRQANIGRGACAQPMLNPVPPNCRDGTYCPRTGSGPGRGLIHCVRARRAVERSDKWHQPKKLTTWTLEYVNPPLTREMEAKQPSRQKKAAPGGPSRPVWWTVAASGPATLAAVVDCLGVFGYSLGPRASISTTAKSAQTA